MSHFPRSIIGLVILLAAMPSLGAEKAMPWNEVLGPSQGKLPPPRDALEEAVQLPSFRTVNASTRIKWETDLGIALKTAQQEGRPLFVTFRCLPCKNCSEFDKTVLEGGPDLDPLFRQFVTVRLTSTSDIDLGMLPMAGFQDLDVSWWSWFLSPDGKVYAIYGGRDVSGDTTRTSKASLIATMQRVLAHHYDPRREGWNIDGSTPQPSPKPNTPKDLPGYESWLNVRNHREMVQKHGCIHCHQVAEIMRQDSMDRGAFNKHRDLDLWPLPENLGIVVDRDDGLKVGRVEGGSVGATAGIKPGDVLAAAGGRKLFGQADLRGVLHRLPSDAKSLEVHWLRNGAVMNATLALPAGWKATNFEWRPSVAESNVGASPGFWPTDGANQREKLGIPRDKMAVRPQVFSGKQPAAYKAGVKPQDIIVAINGESPPIFGRAWMIHYRLKFEPGDEVTLTVVGPDGTKRDVTYKAEK